MTAHPPQVLAQVDPDALPQWLQQLAKAVPDMTVGQLSRLEAPGPGTRPSAVLILFGEGPDGPDVLLTERAADMRAHPGQTAFPGGGIDPEDTGPIDAALREAQEETGLDPSGVVIVGVLPTLWLPPSNHAVTPVLGWWRDPSAVSAQDPVETAAVARVPVAALTDPKHRGSVSRFPGYIGAAFDVPGLFVWGFTAGLLDRLLEIGGFAQPWDAGRILDLPTSVRGNWVVGGPQK